MCPKGHRITGGEKTYNTHFPKTGTVSSQALPLSREPVEVCFALNRFLSLTRMCTDCGRSTRRTPAPGLSSTCPTSPSSLLWARRGVWGPRLDGVLGCPCLALRAQAGTEVVNAWRLALCKLTPITSSSDTCGPAWTGTTSQCGRECGPGPPRRRNVPP